MYSCSIQCIVIFFFFNDTATTEIYTLSLHDALPISPRTSSPGAGVAGAPLADGGSVTTSRRSTLREVRSSWPGSCRRASRRSEEHTSELQSRQYLVCRLLLEKKKIIP